MSNDSIERLGNTNPEYRLKAEELYEIAGDVMDTHDSYASSYKNYGTMVINSMQLESGDENFIVLDRRLNQPLPKDPCWPHVMPRIQKVVPDANRNKFLHEYIFRDGLIIDQLNYYDHRIRNVRSENVQEDELVLDGLIKLIEEIRTGVPVRRFQVKRSRVYKAVDAFLNLA